MLLKLQAYSQGKISQEIEQTPQFAEPSIAPVEDDEEESGEE